MSDKRPYRDPLHEGVEVYLSTRRTQPDEEKVTLDTGKVTLTGEKVDLTDRRATLTGGNALTGGKADLSLPGSPIVTGATSSITVPSTPKKPMPGRTPVDWERVLTIQAVLTFADDSRRMGVVPEVVQKFIDAGNRAIQADGYEYQLIAEYAYGYQQSRARFITHTD